MAGKSIFSGGKGLFTAWDPASALRANPAPTWVAVLPDKITPELAQAFKDKGIALVIWEPKASQAGVDAVNKYGAAGYIAQAEGPEELAAAQQFGAQIHVPKALVSNNFMPAYPPGWIAMPEAYTNNNPNATADQVTRDAFARGATEVVPVVGLGFVDTPDGRRVTAAEYQAGLDRAGAAGASGSAAYIAEQTSDADLNMYTSGRVPSGAGAPTKTQPPEGGGAAQVGSTPPGPPTIQSHPNIPTPPPAPTVDPLYGGENAMPGGGFEGPPDLPPPPYGMPKGPQQQEGELGENWNLGWQQPLTSAHTDLAHPYSFTHPSFAPGKGGLINAGQKTPAAPPPSPDTQPPPLGREAPLQPSLYLHPTVMHQLFASLPYLNRAFAPRPPYGGF